MESRLPDLKYFFTGIFRPSVVIYCGFNQPESLLLWQVNMSSGVMPDLIRHPVISWIPAFAGMTGLALMFAGIKIRILPHLFPAGILWPSKGGAAQGRRPEPLTMD
jgi:hypothetical protein